MEKIMNALDKFNYEGVKAGREVITQSGIVVTQITQFEGVLDNYPIRAAINGKIVAYSNYGIPYKDGERIYLKPEVKTVWCNVYCNGVNGAPIRLGSLWSSEELAKLHKTNSTDFIKTIQITDEV